MLPDYITMNKDAWNKRTQAHINTAFYDTAGFLAGKNMLNDIELQLLGDLKGKKVLHLQCHFGLDTLSLARLGASVTGIDLSNEAIDKAKELAEETKLDARFICCNIYDLKNVLDDQFDIVFTSYGTIGWLPDLNRWADIVAHYIKPGGKFVFAEFHPFVWMWNDELTEITYSYFNVAPIVETQSGTYADKEAPITASYCTWNHPLQDVFSALLNNGLVISAFKEYDYSPYDCLGGLVKESEGIYRHHTMRDKMPMVYSLVANKPE